MHSFLYAVLIATQLISLGRAYHGASAGTKQSPDQIRKEMFDNLAVKNDTNATTGNPSPCTDPSFTQPEYQVSDFQFNSTIIASGERGLTYFKLEDIANNYLLTCRTPYLQDPKSPIWNDCQPAEDSTNPETIFEYIADANRIVISQTWVCELENRTFPHPYFSTAEMDLPQLQCVTEDITMCTLPDNEIQTFGGDYSVPIWNSDGVEPIPSSPIPSNASANAPWNETPCVGLSFSYPNWDVGNFTYNGNYGEVSVSFHLRNHANNQTTTCDYQGSEWYKCDNTTEVRFDDTIAQLSVNQTWSCNATDKWSYYPDLIDFRAVASTKLHIECEGDNCHAIDSVVKGSLTEPIELTPNVAPDGVNVPSCLENSGMPSWELSYLMWNEIYRGSARIGNITVIMRNLANEFNLTCEAQGDELNAEGSEDHERWWGCALAENPFASYRVTTKIQFNPVTRRFATEQTWYCNGNDVELPAKIIGNGSLDTSRTLDCSWKNSTYEDVRACMTSGPQVLRGAQESRTDLARDAFVEVPPQGYSCTISSVTAPKWRVGLRTDTSYADPATRMYDALTATPFRGYRMVDYAAPSLTPFLRASEPARWYDCRDYYAGPRNDGSSDEWARNTLDCSWRLDLATGYFALNHTWFCDDKDPGHP
ncbi:hypothetical protein F4775DRAFT_599710 [Biscogniauxia sp. FL1348]|nr:hypothetical protein F4775DRAFT_599710 [Biscogniauxia sp. FL1348]